MGTVVTKIDIQRLSFLTKQADAYITDQHGVVILAHDQPKYMGAMPDSSIFGMSAQEKMVRYQKTDFSPLPIEPWGDKKFPMLKRVFNQDVPYMLVSRPLPEFDLVALVENDLMLLPALQRERLWAFLGLSLFGSILIVSATGTFLYLRSVRDSKKALQESEAKLRAIIDAAPVPFVLDDDQGNITYLNNAFIQTIGYTRNDIPTLDAWWPRAFPEPEYRHWVIENWQKNMAEAKRTNKPFAPLELNIHCKNGSVRTFMVGPSSLGEKFSGTHLVALYDITERKVAEAKINDLAFYDPLTNLPNRRLLMDRLQHALTSSARSGHFGALLFLDLDNFKTINDTLGHDVGDLLLQQVAQRLKRCVREIDSVARLGGDEFVVMLEDLSGHNLESAARAEEIGEKIVAALNQPYQLATHEFLNSASIGITLFNGDQLSAEELMKQADIAMYQGKKSGRNTMRFFDPQMQNSINARVALEKDLHKAIENRQFQLYYQIQVDSSHQPVGAEVLIRWQHPERGLVPPLQFIPLAEETGMIQPIGQWVLETAFAQLKAWQQDVRTSSLTLSVNVSAKQFRQADFVAQVHAAIQSHGIDPKLIKMELTETMLLDDIEKTIETMGELNEIGIQLSLDDFGTGYSSLQYLKRLPLNQLKIDQSFVRDIATSNSDMAIVRTIISMAQSLGLEVIAEGVETQEQRQFLLTNGCTRYQGYLFSKPVPVEAFESLLKQH
jgi:diguanylate cyclase (GGDEF)-like protein/PAS domain S-box-containing protein